MEKLNKQQVKTILLNAPKGSDYSIIINGLVSKGYVLEGFNDQPKPQEDGIIKGAVKDVANTLLIKPATRVGQAIGGTISQSIINKMPDSDPNKAIYQANLDKQLSQDTEVPLFGKIEAQKGFGDGGERQITSESLKIGSYLFPYGKVASKVGGAFLGSSTKLTPTAIKTAKTVGNVVSGASGGYMADVGYNLADENKTLGESFMPGVGTGLGVAIPLLGPAGRALKGKSKTGADVTNRVIHGTTTDVPLAEQAFKNIDTTGVKTRKELSDRLASAMENQMNVVDQQLAKDTRALSLDDYTIRVKNNAGQEVKTDVITQGLEHLEEFYKNAGDNLSASNVSLLKQKAVEQGLTHQEVNNIARMYSEEFGTKAFNKMGDPLTNVNAQMYQNTRSGLKQAARGGLGYGEEAAQADRLYNAMSNTKRLIDDGVEQVNKLQGKLKERNVVQKLSYGAAKILNTLTGGGLKAGVEALGVSNVGNKIDNWIDFERTLSKDLEFIRKANSIKSDSALIKFIEDYAKKFKFPGDAMVDDLSARGEQIKATPNKNGGFVRIGQSEKATNQRMNSTIKNNIPKTSSISPKSTTVTQKVKEVIPITKSLKVKGEIPSKLEPLAQEASKYKSAEEFVKAQGTPVYRGEGGSNVAQGKALLAEGKHYASDAEYPKGFGKVGEYVIKPDAKVLDLGDSTFQEISKKLGIPEKRYISPKELSTIAKEKGYSVLKYNGEYKSSGKQFTHTVDLTGDSYIPKSQLTDIWKKANKK